MVHQRWIREHLKRVFLFVFVGADPNLLRRAMIAETENQVADGAKGMVCPNRKAGEHEKSTPAACFSKGDCKRAANSRPARELGGVLRVRGLDADTGSMSTL